METNQEGTSGSGTVPEGETGVGDTVEIKIKTPDSQSYTLRVEKNVAVPALKEQLVSVVGVPVESQRLICRGKVLDDGQLLSAYNVEDGHTLHLVARQPPSTSGVGPSTASSEGGQGETGMPPPWGRPGHVSRSLLMGNINSDLNRIMNAAISSMGMHGGVPSQGGVSSQGGTGNADNSNSGVSPTLGGLDGGAANGRNSGSDPETGVRELQIGALYRMPSNSAGNTGQSLIRGVQAPVVVPDALTTMSQYLDRLEQSFAAYESATANFQESSPTEVRLATDVRPIGEEPRQGASPAALGALMNRVNNLLRGQAGSALSRLARRLSSEPTMLDTAARDEVQHAAFHAGHLMQQIGALLLELGRATLSLRMGQSPSESVVNSGPAIFISPGGPNSMLVQWQGASVAPFRHGSGLSHISHHYTGLPRPSAGGAVVATDLPSTPGMLGPSPGVPRLPRPLMINIYTFDPRAFPTSSLSPPPRPSSFGGRVRGTAGGSGFTVRQLLERGDSRNAPHAGSASNDASGPTRPTTFSTYAADGANLGPGSLSPGPTGMQGASVTIDENGAARVVPVRSRDAVHPPAGQVHVDPLLSRFQHQLNFRTGSSPPNATPATAAIHPPPRQMDQASRSLPGGGAVSESRNGDFLHLLNSLTPLLHHLAGALQQSGAPTPPQQQFNAEPLQPPSTYTVERPAEAEVRPTDDAQAVGLGVGSLLAPPARVRRRQQTQQYSQDGQPQPVQETLQNLQAQRNLANDTNPRTSVSPVGQLVRAMGGAGVQQGGGGIVGQLLRSPVVENLVQQVMQGVGDVDGGGPARRGPASGGLDLSGMLQRVVPVVTQMLNGGSAAAFPGSTAGASARTSSDGAARATASREPESERWQDASTPVEVAGLSASASATDDERQQSMSPQRPMSDVYRLGTPTAKRQKTAVESAAEKLEDGGSAEVVLRDLADDATAGISGNEETTSTEDTSQQVVRVDGLAEVFQYVTVFWGLGSLVTDMLREELRAQLAV